MNIKREPLDFNSLPAVIQGMIEDNSQTAAIIDELIQNKGEDKTLTLLIILDDMNIRGMQINNLYKICNQNIDELCDKIIDMNEEDINELNGSTFAVCKYKALFKGTKEDRKLNPEKYIFTDEERNEIRNKKSKDRVQDILEENHNIQKKNNDLYPSITSKEALVIINKHGFNCGYKKKYENKEGQTIIYRVFYNDLGDIMYTHSLKNPDIFLWGESKLNVVRQKTETKNKEIECNAYYNVKDVVGYNIELREKPFTTYQKILESNEKIIIDRKPEYYNSNLIPVIESIDAIKYREENNDYKGYIISNIYNLLTFPETYYDIDEKLKQIYKNLLSHSEEKAYDEIIHKLNVDEGIEIAKKLQDILGISLDKSKLKAAKERYNQMNNKNLGISKHKFLSQKVSKEPENKKIDKRITKITEKETVEIK